LEVCNVKQKKYEKKPLRKMDILKEKGLISVLIPEPEKIALELKYVAFYKIDILYLN